MKKFKKNNLKLDKEVVTTLSVDNMHSLKGGIVTGTDVSKNGGCQSGFCNYTNHPFLCKPDNTNSQNICPILTINC